MASPMFRWVALLLDGSNSQTTRGSTHAQRVTLRTRNLCNQNELTGFLGRHSQTESHFPEILGKLAGVLRPPRPRSRGKYGLRMNRPSCLHSTSRKAE